VVPRTDRGPPRMTRDGADRRGGEEQRVSDDTDVPARRSRPATLEEVARAAGVSRTTVSRVINGSPKVSSQAKRAVEDAVSRLGYAPNRAARSLVTRRTDSIGLVLAESEQRVFGEPFFASLVRGVSHELSKTDVQLVLLLTRSERERARVQRFLSTHLDGVLLVSAHALDPLLDELTASGMPAVLAGRPPGSMSLPYVDADNLGGGRSAVEHLVARGRTRIATITGTLDMSVGRDRLAGYREGLEAAGLALDERLEAVGDFSRASGERGTRELLAQRPDLDAIFAASDLMAVGAIRALEETGRRVPGDVSVVGFDDSVVAESARPTLTSVHQPVEEIGQRLVMLLRDVIAGDRAIPSVTTLPTRLVVRESS